MSARTEKFQQHDVAVAYGATLAHVVAHGMCQAQLRAHFFPRHAGFLVCGAATILGQHLELQRVFAECRDGVNDTLHYALLARAAGAPYELEASPDVHALR